MDAVAYTDGYRYVNGDSHWYANAIADGDSHGHRDPDPLPNADADPAAN